MTSTLSTNIWRFLREVHRTRRERATEREEASLRSTLRGGFREQERLLLAALEARRAEIDPEFTESARLREQEGVQPIDLIPLWREVTERTRDGMENGAQEAATSAFQNGSKALATDLGVDVALDLQHPRAVRFLEQRGAALIRGIDNTTRQEVQRIISSSVREGRSYSALRQELRAKFSQFHTPQPQQHIRDRAELVAVQEMGEAYEAGNLETAEELRDLGVPLEKSLLTAEDDRVDADCRADEAAGWIPLEQAYPSGQQRPPIHVACRCTQLVRRAT